MAPIADGSSIGADEMSRSVVIGFTARWTTRAIKSRSGSHMIVPNLSGWPLNVTLPRTLARFNPFPEPQPGTAVRVATQRHAIDFSVQTWLSPLMNLGGSVPPRRLIEQNSWRIHTVTVVPPTIRELIRSTEARPRSLRIWHAC